MTDIVSPEKRSQMMAGIRGADTKPEILIRKALHARGFRFRLHDRRLPGKPDLVLPKYQAVILIHGCFWHGHDCHLFKWPKTRTEFWHGKIEGNRVRDERVRRGLTEQGWRVLEIWECATKGRTRLPIEELVNIIISWLQSDNCYVSVTGLDQGGLKGDIGAVGAHTA